MSWIVSVLEEKKRKLEEALKEVESNKQEAIKVYGEFVVEIPYWIGRARGVLEVGNLTETEKDKIEKLLSEVEALFNKLKSIAGS